MQSWVQINTNSQTTEITDTLKVFDAFSVFVEPISYQRVFHLVSVLNVTPHLIKCYKYSSLWLRLKPAQFCLLYVQATILDKIVESFPIHLSTWKQIPFNAINLPFRNPPSMVALNCHTKTKSLTANYKLTGWASSVTSSQPARHLRLLFNTLWQCPNMVIACSIFVVRL